jgi:hypothetical protein
MSAEKHVALFSMCLAAMWLCAPHSAFAKHHSHHGQHTVNLDFGDEAEGTDVQHILSHVDGASATLAEAQAPGKMGVTVPGSRYVGPSETIDGDMRVVGADLRIDGRVDGDAVVEGGTVTVGHEGKVSGDVVVTGGNLIVQGRIEGDAVCTGGNVMLSADAIVEGDAVAVGGTVTAAPGARIEGDRVQVAGKLGQLTNILRHLHGGHYTVADEVSAPETFLDRVTGFISVVMFLAFVLFMALLVTVFMPRQSENVEEHLQQAFPQSALLGVAVLVLLPVALVVLAITVVGIVLIPVVILAVIVAALVGAIAISRVLGRRMLGEKPALVQIAAGLLLLFAATLIGTLLALPGGFMVSIGEVVAGIGTVILVACGFIGAGAALLSRFGTRTIVQTFTARTAPKDA